MTINQATLETFQQWAEEWAISDQSDWGGESSQLVGTDQTESDTKWKKSDSTGLFLFLPQLLAWGPFFVFLVGMSLVTPPPSHAVIPSPASTTMEMPARARSSSPSVTSERPYSHSDNASTINSSPDSNVVSNKSFGFDSDESSLGSISEGSLTTAEIAESSWREKPYLSESVINKQRAKATSMGRKGRRLMDDLSQSDDPRHLAFVNDEHNQTVLRSIFITDFIKGDEYRLSAHISEQPLKVNEETFYHVGIWHHTYKCGNNLLNPPNPPN